jgi:hypothetical protein
MHKGIVFDHSHLHKPTVSAKTESQGKSRNKLRHMSTSDCKTSSNGPFLWSSSLFLVVSDLDNALIHHTAGPDLAAESTGSTKALQIIKKL